MIAARALLIILSAHWTFAVGASPEYSMDQLFLRPLNNAAIGDAHGDIAVSPDGEIYVSVQGGANPGIQVYASNGHYLRNVSNAPSDLHGFVIATAPDGGPSIYGARLVGQQIIQLALDGTPLLSIAADAIPARYRVREDGSSRVSLTGIAVAPNGDIYTVDGYGSDLIHRFSKSGTYIGTFGGRAPPWRFKLCHKIAIDTRFTPSRLLCADRLGHRLVHMDLDGRLIGVFAGNLRQPSAIAIFGSDLAVSELEGRVSILDIKGQLRTSIGTNEDPRQRATNQIPPEEWNPAKFYAPHGIAYDASGNLFVTEWNQWGRVVRVTSPVASAE